MRRMTTRVFALVAVVSILALVGATPALAHEARKVGRWNFVVGWGTEPAFAGFPNTVQLILTDAKDVGLADLGDTLKVDVTSAGKTKTLSFEPFFEVGEFGTRGDYRAKIIPTRPGTYEFRINGTIKGDKIDQKFTCSETTFDCVDDPSEVEFPASDPSNAQLADRITKEATRVSASAKDANDAAKLAKTLGYVGIGLGAVALIVALARGRGSKKTAA
jgi:hypothetical protein